jgi:glycosyltransferase involved in cell wall biosynthesis
MNTFSIIVPVYSEDNENFERKKMIGRTIRSVINQQYPHWELILVDDGCKDGMDEILDEWSTRDDRIKVIHKENQNRAIARNAGMDAAKNDWICWLDSDDEYCSHYLRELDKAIDDYPGYKIFNFTSIIYFPDHRSEVRDTFRPAREGDGHEWFRSGKIACGSFIFRRDLWEGQDKYRIPDEESPYGFAAVSEFDLRDPNRPYAFTDPKIIEGKGAFNCGDSLGNPWGDDFFQFYLLTRDNYSYPLDVALYIQYPRSSEEGYEYY